MSAAAPANTSIADGDILGIAGIGRGRWLLCGQLSCGRNKQHIEHRRRQTQQWPSSHGRFSWHQLKGRDDRRRKGGGMLLASS